MLTEMRGTELWSIEVGLLALREVLTLESIHFKGPVRTFPESVYGIQIETPMT